MTDKATMPGEIWCNLYPTNTYHFNSGTHHSRGAVRVKYTRTDKYDSLAAVAQRMHDHLTGRGSTLKDRSDVIDEYNALMKGR